MVVTKCSLKPAVFYFSRLLLSPSNSVDPRLLPRLPTNISVSVMLAHLPVLAERVLHPCRGAHDVSTSRVGVLPLGLARREAANLAGLVRA